MYEMITPSHHYGGWINSAKILAVRATTVRLERAKRQVSI